MCASELVLLVVWEDSVALEWEDAVALLWPEWDAVDSEFDDDDELVPF